MRLTKRPFCLRRIPHGHESRPDDRVHFVPANQLPAAGHVTQTTIATMLCEKCVSLILKNEYNSAIR